MRQYHAVAAMLLAATLTAGNLASAQQATTEARAPGPVEVLAGRVVETMNAAGYTYVQVDTGSSMFWAAAPEFAVAIGDHIRVPDGLLMTNYQSNSLKRTFDRIYFAGEIQVGTETGGAPPGHAPSDQQMDPHAMAGRPGAVDAGASQANVEGGPVDFSGVKKADGGLRIAEIFDRRKEIGAAEISVRAKVVKINKGIKGKNWIHVQDGTTGRGGEHDLTLTTNATAEVGAVILVKGTLSLDKDFGFGYRYDIIIEDARVTAE